MELHSLAGSYAAFRCAIEAFSGSMSPSVANSHVRIVHDALLAEGGLDIPPESASVANQSADPIASVVSRGTGWIAEAASGGLEAALAATIGSCIAKSLVELEGERFEQDNVRLTPAGKRPLLPL